MTKFEIGCQNTMADIYFKTIFKIRTPIIILIIIVVLQQPEKGCYHTTMKEKLNRTKTLIPRHLLTAFSAVRYRYYLYLFKLILFSKMSKYPFTELFLKNIIKCWSTVLITSGS